MPQDHDTNPRDSQRAACDLRRLTARDRPQLDHLDSLLAIQPRSISALLSPAGLVGYEYACYGLLETSELVGRADLVYDVSKGGGYLLRFAIRPDRRGRGLGKHMLDLMLAEARALGLRSLDLHVTESNTTAVDLYKSRGFRLKHNDMHLELSLQEVEALDTASHAPGQNHRATPPCENHP